jgi:DNA-binding response OmpR family regulator
MVGTSSSESQDTTRQQRILIMDDHPSTRELLGHIVEEAGYEAVLASGGEEGLRLLREGGVALVLLDLMMDEMHGWTVLETIKADSELQPVPVIIVTARQEFQEEPRIQTCDGLYESYVMKPFNVDVLLSEIEAILG